MLRQTAAFGLIRAENLPGSIMVSALLIFILMIERLFCIAKRRKQNGGKRLSAYNRTGATAEPGGRS